MSETPSETIARLLQATDPATMSTTVESTPPPSKSVNPSSNPFATKPSENSLSLSEQLLGLLPKEISSKKPSTTSNSESPTVSVKVKRTKMTPRVQSVALGEQSVRSQIYKAYHSDPKSRCEMYFVAARKYQDDEAAAPYMLGRTHYAATRKHQKRMTEIKINAGEEGNPYDYEEAERNWIDWYVGYHHARRDAGDLLTEDTV